MENARNARTIENREKTVISLTAHLSDTELFGLECFLAGSIAGASQATMQRGKERSVVKYNENVLEM